MRRPQLVLLAAALAVLLCPAAAGAAGTSLVLDQHGRVHARHDRFLPPPDRAPARARAAVARAAPSGPTVPAALDALLAAGAIDQARHDAWAQSYDNAKATLKKLHGTRRRPLDAVLANTRALAAGGLLTAQRAPLAFLTLQRNRAWWAGGPLLRYGQRVSFAGSQLVWQYYPGQGIQVQWLGTFGRANGLFQSQDHDPELRALLDEAIALAVPRAGGIAWESLFSFDGGRPPWVSGLSQGTAIQALARAAVRLQAPVYFEVARAALGIFRTPPPEGVLAATPVGAHYLQYSFAPDLRILNGFVQALNGLFDFAALANDADGRALFAAGEAEARVEVPLFDTGAWSLYQPGRESDLGYHKLLRDFLRGLCKRVPDPVVYCTEADKFTAYLRQPPVLALKSTTARLRKPSKVTFTVNKVSNVSVTLLRRGKPIFSRAARFGYGRHAFAFRPGKRGALEVRLRAVDLAGHAVAVAGRLLVRAGK
ncbi:MAG TPA: D-glucuronyl C5-epimerase family protein [Solirubrobacteraceae bacterium]